MCNRMHVYDHCNSYISSAKSDVIFMKIVPKNLLVHVMGKCISSNVGFINTMKN